ncbi:MAG: ATP-dependent DNA helicase RecG [Deltaproteobacteria bacterium]|nr:ATP-dependent DNA helicase RecG [Candidatus Zymogenaceae bacterium]
MDSGRTHGKNGDIVSTSDVADRLMKPVTFAMKDDFANLANLKGFEATAAALIGVMRSSVGEDSHAAVIEELEGLSAGFDGASLEEKKRRLGAIRTILEAVIDEEEKKEKPPRTGKKPGKKPKAPAAPTPPPLSGRPPDALSYALSREKLDTPATFVKGVGPKRAQVFAKRDVHTVEDLLYQFPNYYIDMTRLKSIRELTLREQAALVADVVTVGERFTGGRGRRSRRITEVIVTDGKGVLSLVWFNLPYMKNRFSKGMKLLIRGTPTEFGNRWNMVHPDVETWEGGEADYRGEFIPRYPLPERMRLMQMVGIVKNASGGFAGYLPDGVPEEVRSRLGLLSLSEAVSHIHDPDRTHGEPNIDDGNWLPVKSVAMDEFFIMELGLLVKKKHIITSPGRAFTGKGALMEKFLGGLSFPLTGAQKRVLAETLADLTSPRPTHRLIQGDVGSGKTVVAAALALAAVEDGAQAALMAPTEILAEQHYRNLEKPLSDIGVTSALLTASVAGTQREEILSGLAAGTIQIVFGTHALIQEGVEFSDLGFAVVDEQHRFGVLQRGALKEKGHLTEVLVMTATPIPRTLALTVYGDLDVSVIDEQPPGRKPIKTLLLGADETKRLHDLLHHQLSHGRQAYVVCPLVEESEKLDLKNATRTAEELSAAFPEYRVGLLTGRMKGDEKERVMGAFEAGEISILVSTTVVEVGVDVANATVMVIEEAQRFGLAQLHQLRGRVGRGAEQAYCVLISRGNVTDEGRRRLEVMVRTTDGFVIAEEDLKLRGPGEFLGTRQSGLPAFRAAHLIRDIETLLLARREAEALLKKDPTLTDPAHKITREVLMTRFAGRLSLLDIG